MRGSAERGGRQQRLASAAHRRGLPREDGSGFSLRAPAAASHHAESGTPVDIGGLSECKQRLKFPRPINEGEAADDAWHAPGMLRVVVLVGDASPDVLATEGLVVAELIHWHMGQFLWDAKVSLNGHVNLLQPAKSDEESMWSNREEHFCKELSTIAPNIGALLRRCAEDSHIWVRAMSYGPGEPGSFHMDSPLAGTPLVRLPICLGGSRAFEVSPKRWTDEELRDLSLDDAMITPLERAGGGGAVVLLPRAYISARAATLNHRAGAGEGPGLTLVLEIRCDGSGYGGLAGSRCSWPTEAFTAAAWGSAFLAARRPLVAPHERRGPLSRPLGRSFCR